MAAIVQCIVDIPMYMYCMWSGTVIMLSVCIGYTYTHTHIYIRIHTHTHTHTKTNTHTIITKCTCINQYRPSHRKAIELGSTLLM